MDDMDVILGEIDRLIRYSRLKEIEYLLTMDARERRNQMRAALERLQPGAYLLGTGPSTVGIVSLHAETVVLGRPPTLLESPQHEPADCLAIDTLYFVPREVSRIHAKVVRQTGPGGVHHALFDLHSTCGTYVNDRRLDPTGPGAILADGDIISLGPSQTSTYLYYEATPQRRYCPEPAPLQIAWVSGGSHRQA